jgi:hypothetical protein
MSAGHGVEDEARATTVVYPPKGDQDPAELDGRVHQPMGKGALGAPFFAPARPSEPRPGEPGEGSVRPTGRPARSFPFR